MNALATLEPGFRDTVTTILALLPALTGRTWIVTSGRRTMAEQKRIYAQGRTLPGPIVSNAPPGSSPHNYGLGADLAPLKPNSKDIDWNADRNLWQQMADLARDHGLTAGYYFRTICDMPHIEDPAWKTAQAAWKAGTLRVV